MDRGIRDQHRPPTRQGQRHTNHMPARLRVHHATHVLVDARKIPCGSRHHRVGVTVGDHQRGKDVALVGHEPQTVAPQIPAPLQPSEQILGELLDVRRRSGVKQLELWAHRDAERLETLADLLSRADQDRHAETLREERMRGAQDGRVFAFSEDHALRLGAHFLVS